ncbi:(p)ppGpp synthetase [Klebsiella pneumoniae]|uniref:(p)ppGpp synthetase n=1 Tax=Klebsiella pneumoniae TaxID=573 RepID=UPI001D96C512|nr:(p)ppGpp synthetase [Salmonella enterica]EHI4413274.1 (p)ppGpp synthetase [Salmonella enterica]EHP1583898.1 (p)ppGpp synthetase [Salmonella enterica]
MNMKNEDIIQRINEHIHDYEIFSDRIVSYITRDPILKEHVHSHKKRTKDIEHLDEKITRKNDRIREVGGLEINKDNVMDLITDIVGIRILHLHQGQFDAIHKRLMKYVDDGELALYEKPKAYTWDPEYASFFRDEGITTEQKESFYTSVHYVFKANSTSKITCEVQVRTLFEEVWGEIDHAVNYPKESENIFIKEQLKVFARIVGAGTRMSHSIFKINNN